MKPTPVGPLNTELLSIIPKNVKKIVEVGAAAGSMVTAYKEVVPDSYYIGIENFEEYYIRLKEICDAVYLANIEDCEAIWPYIEDSDCWIFGDVLEHLYDPWGLLKKIRKTIPLEGHICCSLPNAQHWSIQAKLNMGGFRYEESGLLDKTHIRWFTRQTMIELFQGAGFKVVDILAKVVDRGPAEKYLKMIGDFAELLNYPPELAMKEALAFQYVFRAVPDPSYQPE